MRKLLKFLMYSWESRKKRKEKLKQLLEQTAITMVKSRDTSITFGCISSGLADGKYIIKDEFGNILHKGLTENEAVELMAKYGDEAKKKYPNLSKDKAITKHLDDLANSKKLRKSAYKKWITKFEQRFHKHFDGEIKTIYQNDGVTIANKKMQGAHNHEMIGVNFDIGTIRDPLGKTLENLPRDIPFKANVSMVENGIRYNKRATSSFFPLDWNITRMKEEISFVYDDLVKTGKDFSKYPFKHKAMNSEGTFEILIEFDNLGNLTNAYPII